MTNPNECTKCDGVYRVEEKQKKLVCIKCGDVMSFYLWWNRFKKYMDYLNDEE